MSTVSKPRFISACSDANRPPLQKSHFSEDEFTQLQNFAEKVGRRVPDNRFTLAFSKHAETRLGGCWFNRTVVHVSIHRMKENYKPGNGGWPFKTDDPDISDIKIPKCVIPILEKFELDKKTYGNTPHLSIEFTNPNPKVVKDPAQTKQVASGTCCGCIPISLSISPPQRKQ